jgi:predicted  nucleic acid-binding Zn-ribbon protein
MRPNIKQVVQSLQTDRSKSGRQGREMRNIAARLRSGSGSTTVGTGAVPSTANPRPKGPVVRSKPKPAQEIVQTQKILIEAKERDRKILELQQEIKRLKAETKIDSLNKELSALKTKVDPLNNEIKTVNHKITDLHSTTKEFKALQDKISQLEKQTQSTAKTVPQPKDYTKEFKVLQDKISQLEKQTQSTAKTVPQPKDYTKEFKVLQDKISQLEKQTQSTAKTAPQQKDYTKEFKALQDKISQLEKQTQSTAKTAPQQKDYTKEFKVLQDKISQLEKQTQTSSKTVPQPKDYTKEFKALQDKISQLEKQTQTSSKTVSQPKDYTKEFKALQDKISQLEKQTQTSSKTVSQPKDYTKEFKVLQDKISQLEKQTQSSSKTVPQPKDYTKEFKALQDKISQLEKQTQTSSKTVSQPKDYTKEFKALQDKISQLENEVDTKIASARISIRNEQAEAERQFKKEIQETVSKRSQSVPKLQRRGSSRSITPTPIPRRTDLDETLMDRHRLMELPMFSVELVENKIITGGSPMLLLEGEEWNITCDNKNGFEDGRYICPNAGAYDVRLMCKTLSTSVTARITLYHMNGDGKILKAYAMDQSNIINEHCAIVRIAHAEQNDSFALWIENRFNIALKGVENVSNGKDGEGYDVISNMCQIVYNPARGYCET